MNAPPLALTTAATEHATAVPFTSHHSHDQRTIIPRLQYSPPPTYARPHGRLTTRVLHITIRLALCISLLISRFYREFRHWYGCRMAWIMCLNTSRAVRVMWPSYMANGARTCATSSYWWFFREFLSFFKFKIRSALGATKNYMLLRLLNTAMICSNLFLTISSDDSPAQMLG